MEESNIQSPDKLGDSLIALGKALKDPKTKIPKLATMAHKCGVKLNFKFQEHQSQEQLASIALMKIKTGDSITDDELKAGINVLNKTIPVISLFGPEYHLFVSDMNRILSSFEGFAVSRKRYE